MDHHSNLYDLESAEEQALAPKTEIQRWLADRMYPDPEGIKQIDWVIPYAKLFSDLFMNNDDFKFLVNKAFRSTDQTEQQRLLTQIQNILDLELAKTAR